MKHCILNVGGYELPTVFHEGSYIYINNNPVPLVSWSKTVMPDEEVRYTPIVVDREELKKILARALNTMEPQKVYPWALVLADALDEPNLMIVVHVKQ